MNSRLLYIIFLLLISIKSVQSSEYKDIDLLEKINIDKHRVAGLWSMSDAGLTVSTSSESNSRIILPYQPTSDYDLNVSFTRMSGQHSVVAMFTAAGMQAGFEVDAWGQHLAGIQLLDGQSIKDNSSRVNDIKLDNNQVYSMQIQVRGQTVTTFLNGEKISHIDTARHSLSPLDLWQLPNINSLGIGAYESDVVFHSINIREFSVTEQKKDTAAQQLVGNKSDQQVDRLDDLSLLNDDFDDKSSISDWKRVYQVEASKADQLEQFFIDERTGELVLIPYTSSWYEDYRGVLVFKPVTGNFVVSTKINATSRNSSSAPSQLYSLAGIMIRTPKNAQTWKPGQENYIFLSIGSADKPGSPQFEVKTTINSRSILEISPASSSNVEIKVVRIGSHFILFKREIGGKWIVHRRYHRPDMPETLQIGMTVYTDWNNVEKMSPVEHNQTVIKQGSPDLKARFDYFHFKKPSLPDNVKKLNLSDPAIVSNEQLLQYFH